MPSITDTKEPKPGDGPSRKKYGHSHYGFCFISMATTDVILFDDLTTEVDDFRGVNFKRKRNSFMKFTSVDNLILTRLLILRTSFPNDNNPTHNQIMIKLHRDLEERHKLKCL